MLSKAKTREVREDEDRAVTICWMSTQFSNGLHHFLRDFCGFHSQRLSFQKQMFMFTYLMASWYHVLQSARHARWTHLSSSDRIIWSNIPKDQINSIFLQQIFKNKNRNRECLFCVSEGSLAVTFKYESLFSLLLLLLFMFLLLLRENP